MIIGNVCPARKGTILADVTTRERHPRPPGHEPVKGTTTVLGLFSPKLILAVCRHCGGVYVVGGAT